MGGLLSAARPEETSGLGRNLGWGDADPTWGDTGKNAGEILGEREFAQDRHTPSQYQANMKRKIDMYMKSRKRAHDYK